MYLHKQFSTIRFITMLIIFTANHIMAIPCKSPGIILLGVSVYITCDLHLLKYNSQFSYGNCKFYLTK